MSILNFNGMSSFGLVLVVFTVGSLVSVFAKFFLKGLSSVMLPVVILFIGLFLISCNGFDLQIGDFMKSYIGNKLGISGFGSGLGFGSDLGSSSGLGLGNIGSLKSMLSELKTMGNGF